MPIGKTMKNMKAYVLDDDFQPVPVGVAGELFVGGEGLAHCYWHRPELTAEKYVPDPFSKEKGKRLYRTGDLVRWLPDGNLQHLGRIDLQFKLRGFRIEAGEIEKVLQLHESVNHAVVAVRNEDKLVAFIIPADPASFDGSNLRHFVTLRLPNHMIPAFYIPVKSFALTPSGKVDRLSLPQLSAQDIENASEKREFRPPETEEEKIITDIWQAVLGLKSIGADDDFFLLGGHSLNAIRVTSRLSKAFNRDVPLRGIFESPTIAGLAKWIMSGASARTIPKLTHSENDEVEAPLSFTQQRLWFIDQLNPGISSYTIPNMMQIMGPINMVALQSAFRDLVERHEILRTTFTARRGEPVQIVQPVPEIIPIRQIDISGADQDQRIPTVRQYAKAQGRLPWVMKEGPLYRAQLLSLTENEHILSTAFHHIIADGRSMAIFNRELSVLYHAHVAGNEANLPALPLQYADFARWEREAAAGEGLLDQLDYWKHKLNKAVPLDLPADHPRPAAHNFRGDSKVFELPAETAIALRKLAAKESATTFMWILAGFQLLLSRYSGQEDVMIGTVMFSRSKVELEKLIGLFVNTLPLRTDLSNDPSFREALAATRKTCIGAFANMNLPLDEMLKQTSVERDLSRQGTPLFQVMFILEPGTREEDSMPILEQGDTGHSNFDLLLSAADRAEAGISCKLTYDTDLFLPETINRIVGHLQMFFARVAATPDTPISQISFLSEDEERQIHVEWSGETGQTTELRCVHEIIADIAQRQPGKTALVFEGEEISWAELDRRANRLARYLLSLGLQQEQMVGLYLERGIEMIVSLLGVLKAGAAIVTMDPAYPADRIEYMIQATSCPVLLTSRDLLDGLPAEALKTVRRVVCVDNPEQDIDQHESSDPKQPVHLHQLAYVIFTSGSTGLPKGVMVEHFSLTNIIRSQVPLFGITSASRVLQMLSLSFDAAMGEVFRALTAGATLILAHKDNLLPGPNLVEIMKEERISSAAMSPTALAAMPDASDELCDLSFLTVGGEACPPILAQLWGKNRTILNGYGPTETTIGATLAVNWELSKKPPLGRPLPNVKTYVLNDAMALVPVGVPGELYIGGVGVARGYLGRPDLTAERFVPNPFADTEGERLYRTGDLVRLLPDGKLDFLGRIDQQVKIRGYRIELGEIEAVMREFPSVDQCVAAVFEKENTKKLAAYTMAMPGETVDPQELRRFLKTRLPDYMVPALYTAMPTIPVTANGKIDRRALPEPDIGELTGIREYKEPETKTESELAAIWAAVLGVKRVGLNDNFFELGGDSISSIQVVARAAEAAIEISPRHIFQHQTIGELAMALESGAGDSQGTEEFADAEKEA
jgi:amino acid adenylation domain-containing protein